MKNSLRIALLIDADNASVATLDYVLGEIADLGMANVRRAYGDWGSPNLKGWREALLANAIQPVQQIAYTSKGNASDMAMVIEAMDLLHAGDFDAFALMSSDSDFTPLVMRLLTDGEKVYGFGEKKTPSPFVNACSKFTYVEALGRPAADSEQSGSTTPKDAQELRNDARLVQMLRSAVDAGSGDDGWTRLDVVGSQIGNQASFDPRNYGYRKLSDLVKASGLFEMREEGKTLWVREKPRRRAPAKKKAG